MSHHNTLASAVNPVIESLESRKLLAATLVGKTIVVTATESADNIQVTFASNRVTVRINGAGTSFLTTKFDTIDISSGGGADTLTLASNLPKTVKGITVNAGTGNDTVAGSGRPETIKGGAGNDSLSGNNGDDWLYGQDGNDTLWGGAGDADRLYPGKGNDQSSGGAGIFDTVSYEDRTEDITARIDSGGVSGQTGSTENDTHLGDFENAVGGKGNDLVIGNDNRNQLGGAEGNDTLDGGQGLDTIWGDQGSDTVTYASRTNKITADFNGQTINNIVNGHGGESGENDLLLLLENLIGGNAGDSIIGDGNANLLQGGNGNDTIDGGSGNDTVEGGNGHDRLSGGSGNNRIRGGNHNDTITGGNHNDLIYGDAGNDSVDGAKGNDRIFGLAGNDTLKGSHGSDQVDGGTGTDTGVNDSLDDLTAIELFL